mmetsp:Transcript_37369/g.66917  ORF Transcript_37369/g.66917 Transcript_37369/m.66917 type:complete len:273 (-) Transcript_37369:22-840(-)
MSVVTHSPICGSKRFFEHGSPEPHHFEAPSSTNNSFAKRVRRARGSSFGLPSVLQQLIELFPEMEKEVICSVLFECGDNIDAAIKRLGELRLNGGKDAEVKQNGNYVAEVQVSVKATGERADEPSVEKADAGLPAEGDVRSADEWINIVVSEMAAATDMDDARVRAAKVLQTFEHQVQKTTNEAVKSEHATLSAQVTELLRDNGILKRAVQIQNSRMQELAEKDEQMVRLQQTLQQYQEKCRVLELNNYSLSLHLRQAESSPMPQHRHPDVF